MFAESEGFLETIKTQSMFVPKVPFRMSMVSNSMIERLVNPRFESRKPKEED
jgi:hypothetical protein